MLRYSGMILLCQKPDENTLIIKAIKIVCFSDDYFYTNGDRIVENILATKNTALTVNTIICQMAIIVDDVAVLAVS